MKTRFRAEFKNLAEMEDKVKSSQVSADKLQKKYKSKQKLLKEKLVKVQ